MSDFSFRFSSVVFHAVMATLAEIHIDGREHAPREGGCLLMANHISHLDPMLIGMRCLRPVDYMADAPFMRMPVLGTVLRSWNAFEVDRKKSDRRAVKTALTRLKEGRIVGLFPERGLRYGKESMLGGAEPNPGAIALWQMAGVPLLPALILGPDQFYQWRNVFRRPRILIRFGPPLPAPTREQSREELSKSFVDALRALKKQTVTQYDVKDIELPRTAQERWAAKA